VGLDCFEVPRRTELFWSTPPSKRYALREGKCGDASRIGVMDEPCSSVPPYERLVLQRRPMKAGNKRPEPSSGGASSSFAACEQSCAAASSSTHRPSAAPVSEAEPVYEKLVLRRKPMKARKMASPPPGGEEGRGDVGEYNVPILVPLVPPTPRPKAHDAPTTSVRPSTYEKLVLQRPPMKSGRKRPCPSEFDDTALVKGGTSVPNDGTESSTKCASGPATPNTTPTPCSARSELREAAPSHPRDPTLVVRERCGNGAVRGRSKGTGRTNDGRSTLAITLSALPNDTLPSSLEVAGNAKAWRDVARRLRPFSPDTRTSSPSSSGVRLICLCGPPGCGKYAGAQILVKAMGGVVVCLDATTTATQVEEAVMCATHKALGRQQTVLVCHGVDGYTSQTLAAMQRALAALDAASPPILATCSAPNGLYTAALSGIKPMALSVPFYRPRSAQVCALLKLKFAGRASVSLMQEVADSCEGDLRRAAAVVTDPAMRVVKGMTADRDSSQTMFQATERLLRGDRLASAWADDARDVSSFGGGPFTQLLHHNYLTLPGNARQSDVERMEHIMRKAELLAVADAGHNLLMDAVGVGFCGSVPRSHTGRMPLVFPKSAGRPRSAPPTTEEGKRATNGGFDDARSRPMLYDPSSCSDGAFCTRTTTVCGCGRCDTCIRFAVLGL
jgi:hypothetical protein